MVTKTIDIPLPDALSELAADARSAFRCPSRARWRSRCPAGGATIKASTTSARAFPTTARCRSRWRCSCGPILANMKCLIEALKVIEPLIDADHRAGQGRPDRAMAQALSEVARSGAAAGRVHRQVLPRHSALPARPAAADRQAAALRRAAACAASLNVMSGLALQIGSAAGRRQHRAARHAASARRRTPRPRPSTR